MKNKKIYEAYDSHQYTFDHAPYKVEDGYEGQEKYFDWEDDAEEWAEKRREELHRTYCIDKKVPGHGECVCTRKDWSSYYEGIECVRHHYARTVKEHSVDDCTIAEEVYIEEITIH